MTNYTYEHNFWNMMRGKSCDLPVLSSKAVSVDAYLPPDEFKAKFDQALAKDCSYSSMAVYLG